MEATEFAVRLLLLFFPGVICAYIVDTLTIHKPRTQFLFVLNSLILGLTSYFVYWAALWCVGQWSGGPRPVRVPVGL